METIVERPVVAVDAHAHVMRRDAPLVAERHSVPARDVTVEEYLAVLDAHGISHGLLTAPSFYGTDNSLLLTGLDQARGRLRGTAIVAPETTADALRALAQQGICGIRLNWVRRERLPDASTPSYQRLFRAAQECGLHVEIFVEGRKLAALLPHVLDSGVNVVLDHFANPDPELRTKCSGFRAALAALRAGRAWVKLSAPFRLHGADPQPYVDALLAAGGADRLLWGSDWPWVSHENEITYRRCVDWLSEWVRDPAQRTTILRDTPARLFGFVQPAHAAGR
jgi:predicted TIM-barrel fold metal-dependent hydrolase